MEVPSTHHQPEDPSSPSQRPAVAQGQVTKPEKAAGPGAAGVGGRSWEEGTRQERPGWSTADPVPAPPTPRQPGLEGRAGHWAWWPPVPCPCSRRARREGHGVAGMRWAPRWHSAALGGRPGERGRGSGKVGWGEAASHPGGLLGTPWGPAGRTRGTVRAAAQLAETFFPTTLTSASQCQIPWAGAAAVWSQPLSPGEAWDHRGS